VSIFARFFGFKSGVVVYARPEPLATPAPQHLPAVVRAMNLISTDLARLPFSVIDSQGQVVDSPITQLMSREASRWQSGYEFRRYMTTCALDSGNGLALIRRDSSGTVAELQPLPSGTSTVELTEEGVQYRLGGNLLKADQVLHLGCYPDPLSPSWYMSPMESCRFAMELAADEAAAHKSLIRTGSTGKVSISHPGAMSDQTVQAIRDAWQTMHATAEGASRPLILREGMKAERISAESTTTSIESRRFSIQEIARAFGVPPEMLYQQGGGALSSQSETARAYVDGALAQWVTAWESEITRKLCGPGEHARLDTDVLLRGNMRDAGMALSKLVLAGILSPNDGRKRMGLPPIAGDQFDIPSVSMPGGMSAMQGDNATENIDGGEDIA
jgi:HK97 family phage portal protein